METESIKVDVSARAKPQDPSLLGFLSNVFITQSREVEEFIFDESDGGTITSLRSYPDSSFHDSGILFKFGDFTPNHVYKRCHDQFHDHALSGLLTDRIVVESQRRDLPQGPLFMTVFVNFTRKEYFAVPCNSVPSTTTTGSDQSCAICLESMSESSESSKPICELPKCPHKFHEECFIKWLDRNNSCPLCRKPIYVGAEQEEAFGESYESL